MHSAPFKGFAGGECLFLGAAGTKRGSGNWEITAHQGQSQLRFTHGDGARTDGWFATCNCTWGALLHRLKAYAQGASPGPHFKGSRCTAAQAARAIAVSRCPA